MNQVVSLQGYSPELREYLLEKQWPEIMEALVSGVAVMMPEDPWLFIEECLKQLILQEEKRDLQWDMFIDKDLCPPVPLMRFNFMDDTDLPTEEMFEKAYNFRKEKLFTWCFSAWRLYYKKVLEHKEMVKRKVEQAVEKHRRKAKRKALNVWRDYTAKKKQRRLKAIIVLKRIFQFHKKKGAFNSWRVDTIEAIKARVFFENLKLDAEGKPQEEWFYPDGEDPVSLLPLDVSLQIFSHVGVQALCRCAQVCRSWKEIVEENKLWNKMDLSPFGARLIDSDLLHLLYKYRPLLGHLNLRECSNLESTSIRYIGNCRNLQDLNLSECQVTDDALKNIVANCGGLFYLNLSYCVINDAMIRLLTKHCVSLAYLSLAHCVHFTGRGLQSITAGKGCRKVTYLDLSGCVQLTREALQYIGQGCPILHTLLLNDIPMMNDGIIMGLSNCCRTLRHLSLLGESRITDKALKHIVVDNRKLKTFKIENNRFASDVMLRALSKACRNLEVLYVAGCTRISDQGMKYLGSLKKLRCINIADCQKVSDAGIRYLVEGSSGHIMRELNVTNCAKISDVTLLRISQQCLKLTHLNFHFCEHISDTGVELLSMLPSLVDLNVSSCNLTDQGVSSLRSNPNFKSLMLCGLLKVTDDGIEKMASGLGNLESVDLTSCELLTDSGIQKLVFNCQILMRVILAGCPLVGDESAKYISQGCTNVAHLDLSGTQITDQALKYLRKGCTNLKVVNILFCSDITREAVEKLRTKCPEVNYSTDIPKYIQHSSQLPDLPIASLIDRI